MADRFKVLIVEDSRLFREVFKETLEIRFPSMEILEAKAGEEVPGIMETFAPDLVFLDIKLPGESGLAVGRRIKAHHPRATTVIFTGYETEYREAARESADYFISKSGSSEEIFELVEKIMLAKKG